MIRYNAAHRGAEREIFPVTDAIGMPVIAYTALRWGALLQPTPDDPPGFRVPTAPDWYRFVLQSPSVAVVLAAPASRAELDEDLEVLGCRRAARAPEYARLAEHGERVRRHAGRFPCRRLASSGIRRERRTGFQRAGPAIASHSGEPSRPARRLAGR